MDFLTLAFSTTFCLMKSDLSGNTVSPQASGFQNSPNYIVFDKLNERLSTQIVNVARFARTAEGGFFVIFKYSVILSLCT